MATEDFQSTTNGTASNEPPPPAPAIPDYLASPNAVFKDEGVQWRYGRAPDYSKTRKVWEEGKLDSEIVRCQDVVYTTSRLSGDENTQSATAWPSTRLLDVARQDDSEADITGPRARMGAGQPLRASSSWIEAMRAMEMC